MTADFDMRRLDDKLGQFHVSISPVKAPYEWLRANIDNIHSTWEEALSLPRDELSASQRADMHPFGFQRLFAYTLAQLKLCTDTNLLLDFNASLSQWIHFDDVTLLRYHRSLKETLWAFLNRARANMSNGGPPTFTTPGGNLNQLLKLDVLSIATRVLAMVNDDQRKKTFLDQRESHAQTLLDLLQHILDLPELDIVRPSILRVLLELSKRSGLYPTALILRGVEPQGQKAVAAGSYGDIWQGTLAGGIVAIKVMRIDSSYINRGIKIFCKEAIVWRQLHHPNVLPFQGVCQWPGPSFRVCLVSPWMANRNVLQYLQRNPDDDRRSLILDVAQGLNYLHTFDPSVIHGDLRGNNILVTPDKRACIADFGLCTLARDSLLQFTPTSSAYQCTNLLWLAPEFFQFEESGTETPRQSLATDVYSYACVCYEIFAGLPRFSEMRAPFDVVIAVAQDRRPSRPVHTSLDDVIWKLMDKCWSKIPANRPTASDILQLLSSNPSANRPRKPRKPSVKSTFLTPPSLLRRSMLFQDIVIALVGPTGSGKSNFINVATENRSVAVGHDLASCTQDVQTISYPHPDGSGRNIIFVDTPGFDDTEKTDFQILEKIAAWMKETYQEQVTLTGLLFFHRITDVRMRGTPLRNLTMFEALCGKDALENVVLTTTLWDEVDSTVGVSREHQLQKEFWAPLMGEGCRTTRFGNTFQSAWDVINLFDINTPRPLLLQREMVDGEMPLKATSAFKALASWWEDVVTKVKANRSNIPSKQPRRSWKGKGILRNYDIIMKDARATDVVIPSGTVHGNNVASVGHDLKSHTARIEHFVIVHPRDAARRIVFVDTPGFDDTYIDDSEILRRIAVWLAKSYSDNMKLAGVVYLHEISQPRMMGAPRRNLEMFRELCGYEAVRNVVLATTKWEEVSLELGNRREQQLRENYWKHMLELGSQMLRFRGQHDTASAWEIVDRILDHVSVDALQIQEEMVDFQRILPETGAGRALRATLKELLVAQEQMAAKLKEQGAENDERLRTTIEENKRTTQSIVQQIQGLKIPLTRQIIAFFRCQ
ncbi:hypothetical protein DXG01_000251 [Tephrocybe rancida]|nr:hypothetical protein DXG01_000251 [Tephrocybe rancida]